VRIIFFAFQFGRPGGGVSFGSANDLVGSPATAFMVPVVLDLSAWLPDRRLGWISGVVGPSALAVLTVGGPLLIFGVLAFEVQAPIVTVAHLGSHRIAGGTVRGVCGCWHRSRHRDLRARGLAALGVVVAAGGFRRRRSSRRDGYARHPYLVRALGPTPGGFMTIYARSGR
jgi:hypothetical protein